MQNRSEVKQVYPKNSILQGRGVIYIHSTIPAFLKRELVFVRDLKYLSGLANTVSMAVAASEKFPSKASVVYKILATFPPVIFY